MLRVKKIWNIFSSSAQKKSQSKYIFSIEEGRGEREATIKLIGYREHGIDFFFKKFETGL